MVDCQAGQAIHSAASHVTEDLQQELVLVLNQLQSTVGETVLVITLKEYSVMITAPTIWKILDSATTLIARVSCN